MELAAVKGLLRTALEVLKEADTGYCGGASDSEGLRQTNKSE